MKICRRNIAIQHTSHAAGSLSLSFILYCLSPTWGPRRGYSIEDLYL